MRFNLGPSLEEARPHLMAKVDKEAEEARLRFITPGAGQALEYQATEREARAILGGEVYSPLLHPFIAAEVNALQAIDQSVTPEAVAASVVESADQWATVGAVIKELRRAAKLRIERASTYAEALAASQVNWPRPS